MTLNQIVNFLNHANKLGATLAEVVEYMEEVAANEDSVTLRDKWDSDKRLNDFTIFLDITRDMRSS